MSVSARVAGLLDRLSPKSRGKIAGVARALGLDIKINGPRNRQDLRLVKFLSYHCVDTVLDVGANTGQFASELLCAGYKGKIVSFEPLVGAYDTLRKSAAASGALWEVAPRLALSDRSGKAEFFLTKEDTSSSLLQPTDTFVDAMPSVAVVGRTEVVTERLDVAALPYLRGALRPFLKIDVQGAEMLVLQGAANILTSLCGIVVEIGLDQLYANQSRLQNVLSLLESKGFDVWDINPVYRNPSTLRMGAVDITFFRPMTSPQKTGGVLA